MLKNDLLSIGEVAKITGATVKSLRYYEKIGILKPAFIDEESNYRYYRFQQTYIVDFIKLSLELDIPLKELTHYIQQEEIMDVGAFVTYGKKIAEEKIQTLQAGMDFIQRIENMIKKQLKYPEETIYTRKFPKRYYKVIPYDIATTIDSYEGALLFTSASFSYSEKTLPEYGILHESNGKDLRRYAFMEIGKKEKGCKTIPAGEYLCIQTASSQIENIENIFKGKLSSSYLAMEVEIFTDKYNINHPPKEIRILNLWNL